MPQSSGQVSALSLHSAGRWAGYAACVCAFLFAATSFYWGTGGTLGLDLVGREAVELVASGNVGILIALWLVGLLKVAGGLLALALVQPWGAHLFRPWMLLLAGWGVLLGGAALHYTRRQRRVS